jgi:hypothetical protein
MNRLEVGGKAPASPLKRWPKIFVCTGFVGRKNSEGRYYKSSPLTSECAIYNYSYMYGEGATGI